MENNNLFKRNMDVLFNYYKINYMIEKIIEIGDSKQQEKIIKELISFEKFISKHPDFKKLYIESITIPIDFDSTINKMQKTTDYKSIREHLTIAKYLFIDGNRHIILNPILFTYQYDSVVRLFILLHEFYHTVNSLKIPDIPNDYDVKHIYLRNLYTFYDEYYCDREAFWVMRNIFTNTKIKSYKFNRFLINNINGHLETLTDSNEYYKNIELINNFRSHADVIRFLDEIRPIFILVTRSFACFFAHIDACKRMSMKMEHLKNSQYYNKKTIKLLTYIQKKYKHNKFNLNCGLSYMKNFMKNFGMLLTNIPQGFYCKVLDI